MRCGPSGIPCHPHGPRNGAEGAFPIDVDPEMAFREHRARGTAVMSRHAAPQSSKAGNIPFKPITHHRCTPMPATPIAEVRAAPARCMSTPRMDPCQGNAEVDGCHQGNEATRCTRRPRRERCMPYLSAAPPIDVNPKEKRSNATQGSMEWMSPIDGLTTRI